jgi:hypothetical protein
MIRQSKVIKKELATKKNRQKNSIKIVVYNHKLLPKKQKN